MIKSRHRLLQRSYDFGIGANSRAWDYLFDDGRVQGGGGSEMAGEFECCNGEGDGEETNCQTGEIADAVV